MTQQPGTHIAVRLMARAVRRPPLASLPAAGIRCSSCSSALRQGLRTSKKIFEMSFAMLRNSWEHHIILSLSGRELAKRKEHAPGAAVLLPRGGSLATTTRSRGCESQETERNHQVRSLVRAWLRRRSGGCCCRAKANLLQLAFWKLLWIAGQKGIAPSRRPPERG